MKVELSTAQKLSITEMPNLDPVTVILEDLAPGKGKIIIECYGESWSAYWGAMGDGRTISTFFLSCDEHYIAGRLDSSLRSEIADYDAFKDKIKVEVLKLRRSGDLDASDARTYFNSAEYIDDEPSAHSHCEMLTIIFGEEWWYSIPNRPNPDYEYLCRIINAVKDGLKHLSERSDA